jgi:glutamate-1-semialdehyde aminotransferase
MGNMGIGSCILGYNDTEVEAAVLQANAAGNMSSLSPVEEPMLTEELLKITKMDMCRYSLTGGEACAIAARICNVYRPGMIHLQSGYSGWFLGTPEKSWTGLDFSVAEQLWQLEDVVDDISFVIMEAVRNYPEESVKLMREARKFCTKFGIPLIFDEITSGFRMNIGGYAATKDIVPDITVFGKCLGNGHPIAAIVGKREFMDVCNKTFISSTMWSERTGYVAALATLDAMKKRKCQEKLIQMGCYYQDEMETIAAENDLDLEVMGIPPLSHIQFKENNDERMTIYTEQMLKKGWLAGDTFYSSLAHTPETLEKFLCDAGIVMNQIAEGKVKLEGKVRTPGWKRSN